MKVNVNNFISEQIILNIYNASESQLLDIEKVYLKNITVYYICMHLILLK